MNKLLSCPCGKTPKQLHITGNDAKYKHVSGNCCDMWEIEFRTGYNKAGTKEIMELAMKAWNSAPRGGDIWHSADEKPSVNEIGESELCIIYDAIGNYHITFFCQENWQHDVEIKRWKDLR